MKTTFILSLLITLWVAPMSAQSVSNKNGTKQPAGNAVNQKQASHAPQVEPKPSKQEYQKPIQNQRAPEVTKPSRSSTYEGIKHNPKVTSPGSKVSAQGAVGDESIKQSEDKKPDNKRTGHPTVVYNNPSRDDYQTPTSTITPHAVPRPRPSSLPFGYAHDPMNPASAISAAAESSIDNHQLRSSTLLWNNDCNLSQQMNPCQMLRVCPTFDLVCFNNVNYVSLPENSEIFQFVNNTNLTIALYTNFVTRQSLNRVSTRRITWLKRRKAANYLLEPNAIMNLKIDESQGVYFTATATDSQDPNRIFRLNGVLHTGITNRQVVFE